MSPRLSERQLDCLRLIAEGETGKTAAARLYLSRETVKTHMRRIREKLGAKTNAHAVHLAHEWGIALTRGDE